MKLVYLAGPITGLSFQGCTDWREYAKKELAQAGIDGLSPMRAKDYLNREVIIQDDYDARVDIHPLAAVLSSSRGITTRDHWDCSRCDVILVNFLGAKAVSIGTVMEIAWGRAYNKPVVVAIEKEGNPHDHSMVRECIGFRVETLEAGLSVAKAILSV